MIKVGINGFGRIGRLALRVMLRKYQDKLLAVAINTSGKMEPAGWLHLFQYDTVYHQYPGEIKTEENNLVIDGVKIAFLAEKSPDKIPWGNFGVQTVIESTGVFLKEETAKLHLRDSVKKVVLAAPPKDDKIPLFVIGVNDKQIQNHQIISAASCTTNCLAPLVKVLDEYCGIKKALMSTIHAYTSDQELLDGSHKDWRRARAAAVNIVPTTTGAARSVAKVYPKISGKIDGLAFRVPVVAGSLTDLVFVAGRTVTKEEINNALLKAAEGELRGILDVINEPLVSSDIIGCEASSLADLSLTQVIDGDLVKVVAWYDNEWAYSCRLVEEVILAGE